MAELFQRDKSVISRHVKNVFEEGELIAGATVAKSAMVLVEPTNRSSRAAAHQIEGSRKIMSQPSSASMASRAA
jgi:hypothetical protein